MSRLLPEKYTKIGWSPMPYDLCWMACPNDGYRLRAGNSEICLCLQHLEEMESSAKDGYMDCKPPESGGVYTIWDAEPYQTPSGQWEQKIINDGYWWPWQPVQTKEKSA